MNLFYREKGTGQPLIILHGLLGASDNWLPIAGHLSDQFRVIIPDLRNHGQSPHNNLHDYDVMSDDVIELINALHLPCKPHIIGHSMGGKVVMALLLKAPSIVSKAIIIDIAPVTYPFKEEHNRIFDFIREHPLNHIKQRDEIRTLIQETFPEEKDQQLLMKNIRKKEDRWEWKVNIEALQTNKSKLMEWPGSDRQYTPEVLFIKGENSDYITGTFHLIKNFPAASLSVIPGAGHWIHVDQPENLIKTIRTFLLT